MSLSARFGRQDATPLDAAEFEALMRPLGPFPPSRRVAVAVSGGADSMALALLATDWGEIHALVVDHGLRPESAAEAALAAARLGQLGVPTHTLALSGLRRGPALHARARTARYAALIEACAAAGMADILLGHHAADQAETSAMREASGSGPAGLAGMAAVLTLGPVRLLRPLLGVAPARLRATLRRAGVDWTEDPSNRDLSTRRAQLRAGPPLSSTAAPERGAERNAAEAALAHALGRGAAIHPEGFALVVDGALAAPALSALAWTLSGQPYPPPPRAVAHAVAQAHAAGRSTSLHGVLLRRWRGRWLIAREPAAVAGPVEAVPGAIWDGRYRLLPSGSPPPGCSITALGDDASRFRAVSPLPSVVLRSLPAIREKNALVAAPFLVYPDSIWCEQVPLAFCPGHSVAGEPFVAATCAMPCRA